MGSIFRRLRSAFDQGAVPSAAGPDGLTIRTMASRDLEAVHAIETASFGSPWRSTSYGKAIRETRQQFFTAELGGTVVGYAGFWIERDKAHIAKVAVHPDWRRRGIGTSLLLHVLDQIRRFGLGSAYLEVRKSNLGAQQLYRRFGFTFERVQSRAYPNDGEDALVLARDDLLRPAPPVAHHPGTEV